MIERKRKRSSNNNIILFINYNVDKKNEKAAEVKLANDLKIQEAVDARLQQIANANTNKQRKRTIVLSSDEESPGKL